MNASTLIVPVLVLIPFLYAALKKIPVYDAFTSGAKKAIPLIIKLLPYICVTLIMSELFSASGLNNCLAKLLSPLFSVFGIPKEIFPLALVKPFSGSGSLSVLNELLNIYGADSYVGKTACVVYGSSETVFYVSAIYYSSCNEKAPLKPLLISLAANFVAAVFASFLCKIV